MNETLTFDSQALYSVNHKDGLLRTRLTYNLLSNLGINIGADRFFGDQQGLFGQFDEADRISIGFVWGIN